MMGVNTRNMQSCLQKCNKLNKSHLVGQLLNLIHDARTDVYKICLMPKTIQATLYSSLIKVICGTLQVNVFYFHIIRWYSSYMAGHRLRVIRAHSASSVLSCSIWLKAIKIVNLYFYGLKYNLIKCAVCSISKAASQRGASLLVSEYFWFIFKKLDIFPRCGLKTL